MSRVRAVSPVNQIPTRIATMKANQMFSPSARTIAIAPIAMAPISALIDTARDGV